ncbi:AraC family transcriptional regulator [Dyadobacter sp. CY326]|uniref:helix-turn-helix domain-containing protein n=1 Tax=Dyadobacter sp. CY326 TaxID=2907300 RepID=UPI001F3D6387|nr:AraC family transcriptional regulator [Dyadobacter sp. CY326]MCE7067191.1 AraC family transcriptional regulator [Dyadobacter sp. CY326]
MVSNAPLRIKSITEFHRVAGLSSPLHPLISLVDYSTVSNAHEKNTSSTVFDFFSISIKRDLTNKLFYGQQTYDFDEGVMYFLAPGQVLRLEALENINSKPSGWLLLFHPDFLWNTSLSKDIGRYNFFGYACHEALFLSEKEEETLKGIIENISREIQSNIDQFSQLIIVAQLEGLFRYADRFYNRQFITRNINNHHILSKLEALLDDYFDQKKQLLYGPPSVQFISEKLNVSPNYLSGLLKTLTGLNTQQHIQEKLIAIAKQKLSTTDLTVSEIAYELGFEHLQSFSKLFKNKTKQSPLEFRRAFQ